MTWQEELKNSIRDIEGLRDFGLVGDEAAELQSIIEKYPISIPRYYAGLIDKNDPNDPIRRMSVPQALEMSQTGSFDTSGEAQNTVAVGLQHKYRNTALILSTNVCAMYCRHCFRKRMVGVSEAETMSVLDSVTDYIEKHTEIDNVLISGGDALLNSNSVIESYLKRLVPIKHLKLIRFGTRAPVVLPSRINDDPELVSILKRYTKQKAIYVVTQFNHPRELTNEAARAIASLQSCGITVNNQTVLLKGVNDDPNTLAKLMSGLTTLRVVPYYVFQCRPVTAVKEQFQVPLRRAVSIVESAKAKLNGHAKRFTFAMSHEMGKLEILGVVMGDQVVFKFHQPKNIEDAGRMFVVQMDDKKCWLENEDIK